MELSHCLYLSRLSGSLGDTGLRDLLTQARTNNQARAITGALLFDGERFIQLVEGPTAVIDVLAQCLRDDPRHHGFTVLGDGPVAARRHRRWTAGYVDPDQVDEFEQAVAACAGATDAALAAFDRLLASADVE